MIQTVDLTSCDREPIHIPGLIQPHGLLLVMDGSSATATILIASENAEAVVGVKAADLIGKTLRNVLRPDDAEEIAKRLGDGPLHLHPVYIHAARGRHVPTVFNAVAHRMESWTIIELEPLLENEGVNATDLYRRLQTAMVDLRQNGPVVRLCERLAVHVRGITGFDRVMVYRFDPEWNGEVVAEEKRSDLEPFLGLHYPAADIPRQARELYTRNWLRFISDRRYTPAGLFPSSKAPGTDRPLDMSFCVLRSVSPIHLEYLKNMGVDASMSISLIRGGQLWGLVACHHYSARRVPYDVRAACELIGQVVSLQLAEREQAQIVQETGRTGEAIDEMMDVLVPGPQFAAALAGQADRLLSLIPARGLAIVNGDDITRVGQTPGVADIRAIAEVAHNAGTEIFETDKLSALLPLGTTVPMASGVLAVSFSRVGRHCVMWFRPEQVRIVNWAGDPAKSVAKGDEPARLSPRGSFALWKETVRGRSQPWTAVDLATAEAFRKAMAGKLVAHADDVLSHNVVLKRSSEEKDQILDSERAARAQAERINRLTDEFVATLSHELRTPLNAIQGWVHLLRNNSGATDLAKGLDVIDRNARVQTQMVNDLLDMSRINSGKLRLDVQHVDLPQVVEAALNTIQFSAETKAIRLHKTIDPMPGIMVSGDPQRLQQIVWNLLSNAVKFTPKGGLVHVEVKRSGSYVELSVRDNGVGIPRDFLPHVFDRFRQADASTTRSFGGLGLGLSIVRHLTEMHGGSIAVESPGPGGGAVFTVTLPVRALSTDAQDREPHPSSENTGLAIDRLPISGLNVLVVDDEQDAREFVCRLLSEHNVKAVPAGSVAEAMALLHQQSFDLILSDIGMPGEDGYALIRQIRQFEARRGTGRVPCAALTAYARADDRRRIMLAGFQVHISKPVEPAELLAVVANLTGRI